MMHTEPVAAAANGVTEIAQSLAEIQCERHMKLASLDSHGSLVAMTLTDASSDFATRLKAGKEQLDAFAVVVHQAAADIAKFAADAATAAAQLGPH